MERRTRSAWVIVITTMGCLAWHGLTHAQEEPQFRPSPGGEQSFGGPRGGGPQGSRGPGGPNRGPGELFEALDANHDGVVTENEVVTFARERFRDGVRNGDANHDGKLSRDEFDGAAFALHNRGPGGGGGDQPRDDGDAPRSGAEIVRTLDRNGDGKLTLAEVPEPHKSGIMNALERLGRGPQGSLTAQDLDRLAQSDHGGSGRPPGGTDGSPGQGSPGQAPNGQGADDGRWHPDPETVFRLVDRNRDGRVDRVEAQQTTPGPRALMTSLLDRAGKGSITKNEFLAAFSGGDGGGGAGGAPGSNYGAGGSGQGNGPGSGPGNGPGGGNGPDRSPDVDGLFLHYDRNGDGKLTAAEVDGPENEFLRSMLAQAGKSQTGATKAEFKKLFGQTLGPQSGPAKGAPQPTNAGGGRSNGSSPAGR